MKRPKLESSQVPDQVVDLLESNKIGYLSVLSKSEELYSYPVAFHYSDYKLYFMTPVSAAKFKILKANPTVSFIVDNGKVTTEACGAMIQGKAKIFTIGRTLVSILSVGPKMIGFTKKYPGMLSFYARGKELPDERKLYKYRLIRITPTKIIYWIGYSFGRWIGKTAEESDNTLDLPSDESGVETVATLLQPVDSTTRVLANHDWLATIGAASPKTLSADERRILAGYKSTATSEFKGGSARVSEAERTLLRSSRDRPRSKTSSLNPREATDRSE